MSKPKYPSTRADFVALPDNFTPVQSFDSSQVHGNTPLNTAIAQLLRAVINVGNIAALETDDKTNIVNAINEIIANAPIVKTSDNGFVIVAEGANRVNKATAQNAFAEGGKTEATGTTSHAEGFSTLAEGSSAHAEGQGTIASGLASHSEGSDSTASGSYSHVEGKETVAYGTASHAEGNCMWSNTVVSRAYTAGNLYLYVKQEVHPGYVITSDTQTVGVRNCVLQEQDDYKLSLNAAFTEDIAANEILSVAPSAYGSYSHTEGSFTVAMGDSSHAEGSASKALGDYSHAEGLNTKTTNIAEHASGKYNKSTPNVTQFSVGIGTDEERRTNAYEVTTDGKMYVKGVGGYDGTNVTSNNVDDLATAISQAGGVTDYNDLGNVPLLNTESGGYKTPDATEADSAAFASGYQTIASGAFSHTEGYQNTASGFNSHAEGNNGSALNESSHSEGSRTFSYGIASHSEGKDSLASGDYSHAEGQESRAIGEVGHAEGIKTIAYGKGSHAEGYGGNTLGVTEVFEISEGPGGLCQLKVTVSSVQVGDILYSGWEVQTSNSKRIKVLEVLEETLDFTLVKVNAPISQISYIATGWYYVLKPSSKAAYGIYSHVEGYETSASGDYSHAEGYNTYTTNDAEHASGKFNKSTPSVTQFSVGIGGGVNARANAFEIDTNGNVYIKGIGGYIGDNLGQSGVESVQEVIARLEQALGGNNS